jgi:hypothetical protein
LFSFLVTSEAIIEEMADGAAPELSAAAAAAKKGR